MNERPDDWTIRLAQGHPGRGQALEELRGILLRGLLRSLSGRPGVDESFCEDVVQVALVRVLEKLDQFEGRSRFTTWAHAIATNTAFAELRRKRWQDVSFDALVEAGHDFGEAVAVAGRAVRGDEGRGRLLVALHEAITRHLTDRQRAAIVGELRGLPFDQVAQLLGGNRNAAYKVAHDARRAIRRHLDRAGFTAEDIRSAFE